jgi:hypothetical protein
MRVIQPLYQVRYFALAAAVATAALAAQEYFARHWGGGPMSFSTMVFAQGIGAGVWVLFAFLIVLPLARHTTPTPRWLVAHVAAGLVVAVAHTLVVAALFASYYYPGSWLAIRDVFRDRMHTGYAWSVVVYLLIAGAFVVRRTRGEQRATQEPVSDEPGNAGMLRRLLVKSDGRMTPVPAERIDWLEAADNYVVVHAAGAKHTVRGTLAGLAERLDPERFVRVHRGAVVNVERVREVQTWFHGELVAILDDQTRVTVGRTYRDRFLASLER